MRPMRGGWAIGMVLSMTVQGTAAPFTGSDRGTRGPSVLRQEPGVRAAGLGGSYTALANDSTGVFWNPGAIQHSSGHDLSLLRSDSFGQTYTFASYTRPVWWARDRRTLGFSLGNVRFPPVEVVENLDSKGTVFPQQTVLGLTYAQPWSSVSVGGTVKWIYRQSGEEASWSWALDGGLFGPMYSGRGSWGVAVQNVGLGIKEGEKITRFPFVSRAGMAWRLFPAKPNQKQTFIGTGEVDLPIDNSPQLRIGLEYERSLTDHVRTSFRAGWRSTYGSVKEGEAALGFGVTMGSVRTNYAFVPNQSLGDTQWVDIGFRFGHRPDQEDSRSKLLSSARSDMAKGHLAGADEKLEEALKLSPNNWEARQLMLEVRRRFDQSVHPETLFILGERAFNRKNFDDAADFFQKLILVDPNHHQAKKLLTQAESELARARADRIKKQLAQEQKKEREDLFRQAKTASAQKQWVAAINAWRIILARENRNAQARAGVQQAQEALYSEARSLESSGRGEKAIALYVDLINDDPHFRDCVDRKNNLENQSRAKNEKRAQARYEEGLRALQEKRSSDARTLFQEAVNLAPQNKTYLKALERTQ